MTQSGPGDFLLLPWGSWCGIGRRYERLIAMSLKHTQANTGCSALCPPSMAPSCSQGLAQGPWRWLSQQRCFLPSLVTRGQPPRPTWQKEFHKSSSNFHMRAVVRAHVCRGSCACVRYTHSISEIKLTVKKGLCLAPPQPPMIRVLISHRWV